MSAMVFFGNRRSRSPCGARSRSLGIIARVRAIISPADGAFESGLSSTRLLFQLDRLEVRRQYDLQHLAAVGIVEHLVNDALRLQPAVAGIHGVSAVPLDLGFDRALEHIDHLEVA